MVGDRLFDGAPTEMVPFFYGGEGGGVRRYGTVLR